MTGLSDLLNCCQINQLQRLVQLKINLQLNYPRNVYTLPLESTNGEDSTRVLLIGVGIWGDDANETLVGKMGNQKHIFRGKNAKIPGQNSLLYVTL